jgi:hypothetical protein
MINTTSSQLFGFVSIAIGKYGYGIIVASNAHNNSLGSSELSSNLNFRSMYTSIELNGDSNVLWASVTTHNCAVGLSIRGSWNKVNSPSYHIHRVTGDISPPESEAVVAVRGNNNQFEMVTLVLTEVASRHEGIAIYGTSNVFLSGSIAVDGSLVGLNITGQGFLVKDSNITISNTQESAIEVASSDVELSAAIVILQAGGNGLHLLRSARGVSIQQSLNISRVGLMSVLVDADSSHHAFGSLTKALRINIQDGAGRGMYLAGSDSTIYATAEIRNQGNSGIYVEGSSWQIDGNFTFDDTSPDRWSMFVQGNNNRLGLAYPMHLTMKQLFSIKGAGLFVTSMNNTLGSKASPATIICHNLETGLRVSGLANSVVAHGRFDNDELGGSGVVLEGTNASFDGSISTWNDQLGVVIGTFTNCQHCSLSGSLNTTKVLHAILIQEAAFDRYIQVNLTSFRCNIGVNDAGTRSTIRGHLNVRNASIAALSLFGSNGTCLSDGDSVVMTSASSTSAHLLIVRGANYRIAQATTVPVLFTSDASMQQTIAIYGDGVVLGEGIAPLVNTQGSRFLIVENCDRVTVKLQAVVCTAREAIQLLDVSNSSVEISNLNATSSLDVMVSLESTANSKVIIEGSCSLCRGDIVVKGTRNSVWADLVDTVAAFRTLQLAGTEELATLEEIPSSQFERGVKTLCSNRHVCLSKQFDVKANCCLEALTYVLKTSQAVTQSYC